MPPRTIRFHLDEHCPKAIAKGLRRHGIDVTTTSDSQLHGAVDEKHVQYTSSSGRVIFTMDKDFLRIHSHGYNHAGIVYAKQKSRSIGEIIEFLVVLWEIYEPEEMIGRVEYL